MPTIDSASLRRARPWALVVLFGALVILTFLATPEQALDGLIPNTWGSLTAILVVIGVSANRPERRAPWLLVGLGLGLMSAGSWTHSLQQLASGGSAGPSLADAFMLLGEVVFVAGLLGILRGRLPGSDRAGVLDALILATGFGVLFWVWFMGPMTDSTGTALDLGVALAYPILDLALLGILGRLAMAPGPRVFADRLWILGVGAFLVGDLGAAWLDQQGRSAEGDLIGIAHLISGLAFAAAALHPSMRFLSRTPRTEGEGLSTRRMLALGGACLLSPGVLLIQASLTTDVDVPVIAVGTLLLISLVLARLFLAVSELRRILGERQKLEAYLKRQALHDPLTGLANRLLFADRLGHALARRRDLVAVLYLDMDDFKTVNDTLGHAAGDELLVRAGERIRSVLREHDTAARLGGDEFAVLLEDSPDLRVAAAIAERLLCTLAAPVEVAGQLVVVRASIGISLGVSGATQATAMMREADIAMYLAKGQGKGRYAVFEPTMHLKVVRGFELRNDLELAVSRNELTLDYQPIVHLATGRTFGVEALVRWQHPVRGLLPPLDFVPLAEATGLIMPIGRWVLDEACRALARMAPATGLPELRMSVNLSPIQLADPLLVPRLAAALATHRIDPGLLVLELTETAVPDPATASRILGDLHDLGVRLAIDDFGAGYSSLGLLGRIPVDIVKLDQSFVHGLSGEDRSEALASGVIALGRSLGLQVVAEGIERQDQLETLRALSCELGQGNHLAPAMSEAALLELMMGAGADAHGRRVAPGTASSPVPNLSAAR